MKILIAIELGLAISFLLDGLYIGFVLNVIAILIAMKGLYERDIHKQK